MTPTATATAPRTAVISETPGLGVEITGEDAVITFVDNTAMFAVTLYRDGKQIASFAYPKAVPATYTDSDIVAVEGPDVQIAYTADILLAEDLPAADVTTPGAPVPALLSAPLVGTPSIDASTGDVTFPLSDYPAGAAGFVAFIDGNEWQQQSVEATSWMGTNITPGQHQFTISTVNSAGKVGPHSSPVSFNVPPRTTTTPPTQPPPANAPVGLPTKYYTDATLIKDFDLVNLPSTEVVPFWYADGQTQNGTVMKIKNVLKAVKFSDGSVGVRFVLDTDKTGGLISSSPFAGANPGVTFAPSPGKGIYLEFRRNAPAAPNGVVANWPELWATGGQENPVPDETWQDEDDVDEGLGGTDYGHAHWSEGTIVGSGGFAFDDTGWHRVATLWEVGKMTWIYDGVAVGSCTVPTTADAMWMVCGNSLPYNGSSPLVTPANLDVSDIEVWEVTMASGE